MEDEGEIECLEEDEDLVQQLLHQNTQVPIVQRYSDNIPLLQDETLLVEKKPDSKRKHDDDDSDYDPSRDPDVSESEYTIQNQRKKKRYVKKYSGPNTSKSNTVQLARKPVKLTTNQQLLNNMYQSYEEKLKNLPNLTVKKQPILKSGSSPIFKTASQERKVVKRISYNDLAERRKLNIRIPDYEDPICLPVRAWKQDEQDLRLLKQWNKLCLDQYRKMETPLLSYTGGQPVKSSRLIVLRNVKDKNTGKVSTSIQGETLVTDNRGDCKRETFQGVLPKYREKKVLSNYPLAVVGRNKKNKHVYEVVLSKEKSKTEDTLVVYKPKEALSAVYKFSDKPVEEVDENKLDKKVLEEVTCAKVCSQCFHTSWRGVNSDAKNNLECPICVRQFMSVYSLLTHLKNNHTKEDVRRVQPLVAKVLATVVEYHYKCRICRDQFSSIKETRKHVSGRHQGTEVFKCEVGNHMAS